MLRMTKGAGEWIHHGWQEIEKKRYTLWQRMTIPRIQPHDSAKTILFPSELGIRQRAMSQIRITDKRLIPQIKEYLEQSVGSLVTESSIVDYLTSRFPELFVAVPSQR